MWHFSSANKALEEDVATIAKRDVIPYTGFLLKIFLLQSDHYFRQLFYFRIGRISALVKWYAPGDRSFIIACESLGGGVYFPHPYATIIYAKSIGKNFACRQCTTIGNKSDSRDDERPIIGDNVVLGAHVCVIGDIRIGDNVVVGAGSVVIKDVPDNCVVAGNPAHVVRKMDINE